LWAIEEGYVTFWKTYYHVVWGTKRREHLIDDARGELIRSSLLSVAIEHEAILRAVGIMPDHVHVVVSIPPKIAVAELIGRMKGVSSRRVNSAAGNADDGFGWQAEYGLFTFGQRALEDVVTYVENQREIHEKRLIRPSYEQFKTPLSRS
jgi:putative transposase